ncbi:MAG: hypothetical protein QM650_15320 [Microlunatus sp.]
MPMASLHELSRAQRLRVIGNLVNLSTPAGRLLAHLGGCSRRRGPLGLVLAEGYRLAFPVASAFTVGDVVITAHTFTALQQRMPLLLEHEERHSWQYFWCLGLPFLVPYTLAMGWSVLRTGDRAARNIFERNAGLADGGYVDVPAVPLTAQLRRIRSRLHSREPGYSNDLL